MLFGIELVLAPTGSVNLKFANFGKVCPGYSTGPVIWKNNWWEGLRHV